MHLRINFFGDILNGFGGYKERFAQDLAKMNEFITASGLPPLITLSGLPPLITLVLDQYPGYGGRGHQIAKAAEQAAEKAGAVVIPTDNYYRLYTNMSFHVTRWEGHPDEVANRAARQPRPGDQSGPTPWQTSALPTVSAST